MRAPTQHKCAKSIRVCIYFYSVSIFAVPAAASVRYGDGAATAAVVMGGGAAAIAVVVALEIAAVIGTCC